MSPHRLEHHAASRFFRRGTVALAIAVLAQQAVAQQAGAAALDAESRRSTQSLRTGAQSAWSLGTVGSGQVVALIDTGVRATHVDLSDHILRGFNAVDGGIDTGDASGHGTHVAGLLAASRDGAGTVGVAPGVGILPVRVFMEGGVNDAVLSAGIRWAAARSRLLNLSLSAGAPIAREALREAVASGALVVVAAGNRGAAHPDWPARFAREAWANGPGAAGALIAVGAVDGRDRIASFSNRAGDTAAWYLVAPGVDLASSDGGGDTGSTLLSGTSMAAPAVSGAAALLGSRWPRLTPRELASILLVTARDLGAPGTDPVYGRGLLDVEAAMRPVGTLLTATATGVVPMAATGLRLSPATVAIGQATRAAGLSVVATDAYRRDYTQDLAARIADPLPMQVDRAFETIDRRLSRVEQRLPGGGRLSLQPGESFSMVARDAAGEFAFAAGGQARDYFGIGSHARDHFGTGTGTGSGSGSGSGSGLDMGALANPYAGFAPTGAMVARGLQVGDTTLKAGLLAGAAIESSGAGWSQVSARTTVVEASHRVAGGLVLGATWTSAQESGAWLGAVGSGGLAMGQSVQTDALQLGAAWATGARSLIAATWSLGWTPAIEGGGMIASVSDTRSDAMSLAFVFTDAIQPGDGLSLAVSQPMRTRAGEAGALLQTGVDAQGGAVMSAQRWSMVPTGRELVAELAYRASLGRDRSISGALGLRRQPNHDASAAPDTLVALRYRQVF
jgi:hypothetical protein